MMMHSERSNTPASVASAPVRSRALRYVFAYLLPMIVTLSLLNGGLWLVVPVLYLYGLLPLVEWFLPTSSYNLTAAEEASAQNDRLFDLLLYLALPVHYAVITLFLILAPGYSPLEFLGATLSVGLMCGVFGINVGHELGHRSRHFEQRIAQLLLLSSLYTHFYIEHNRGHHRRVATPADPATARLNEPLYAFWWRSITAGYLSAWRLEAKRLRKRSLPVISRHNQMLQFQLIQLLLLAAIQFAFGSMALIGFVGAAIIGVLMLETVNYIEHYGLSRTKLAANSSDCDRYERVRPHHSWNSDHWLGRLSLFELTRHSDHHFRASRHYQILRHHEESPQLPAGYPAMMLLACAPPLWFRVMNPRVKQIARQTTP